MSLVTSKPAMIAGGALLFLSLFVNPAVLSAQPEQSLFLVVLPEGTSSPSLEGIEIWDRLWIGGKEVVLSSSPAGVEEIKEASIISIVPFRPPEGIYIVTSPRGELDDAYLLSRGIVYLGDSHAAVLKTDASNISYLSARGYEIRKVLPPPKIAPLAGKTHLEASFAYWDPVIQQIIDGVSADELWSLLGKLSGEESVTIGDAPYTMATRNSEETVSIDKATQYCHDYFQGLGLTTSYQDYNGYGYELRNVIAVQEGTVHPEQVYIICAHLDDMPCGSFAPGSDDNASGSTAVMHAASVLKAHNFENTIRYVLFTAEEQGLIGSYYYVQELVNTGVAVKGAVNLDMISYNSDSDPACEIHCGTTAASGQIGDLLIDTISRYSLGLTPHKWTVGSETASDHARFWNVGYPAILGIEDSNDFNPYYHEVDDRRANDNLEYLTALAKAVTGTIARLAQPVSSPDQPALVLEAALSSLVPQDRFSLTVRLQREITAAFDFYILADTPYGNYKILINGNIIPGIGPVFANVLGYRESYSAMPFNAVRVPGNVRGVFSFYAVVVEAGMIPPVSSLAELTSTSPYVIAFDKKTVLVQ